MLCQRCGKKEANVHVTKIINGKKTELFLCEDCAKETGQLSFTTNNTFSLKNINDPFSFHNLLAGLLNPNIDASFSKEISELKCDNCGMTYKEFSKKGLLGCSQCYNSFSKKLKPLIKRIHGSNEHTGKVPIRKGGELRTKKEIQDLKTRMKEVIEKENFEKAAELRDKIHEMENNLDGGQDE